jgi:outer membrane protein TolC
MKTRTLIYMIAGLSMVSLKTIGTAETLSLSEAYRQGLEWSPALNGAKMNHLGSEQGVKQVKSNHWPTFEYKFAYTRGDDPVYVFGSLLRQEQFAQENFALDYLNNPPPLTNFRNALEAGIPLYTGNEISDQKKLAKIGRDKSQISIKGAEIQVGVGIVEAYLNVLGAQIQIQIMEDRIKSSEEELGSAQKLMKKGLVLGSDYYAALGILDGMKAQLEAKIAAARAHQAQLNILLGNNYQTELSLDGVFMDPRYDIPDEKEWGSLIRERPDLRMAELDITAAQEAQNLESRTILPRVVAFGSIETNTDDFSHNPSNLMGGVKLGAPFGDPSYMSRKRGAAYYEDGARAQIQFKRDQALSQVIMLKETYEGAIRSLERIKQAQDNAAKSLEMFRPLYRKGRQSVLEVIRAEEAVANADSGTQKTLQMIHLTYAQLMGAVGQLDQSVVDEIGSHLGQGGSQ